MSLLYNETVFMDLIKRYPTWEKLEKYLESEEGGLLRILNKKDDLCIIRYDKSISSPRIDLPHYRWFRSVVWNMKLNCPVSIAPPKTSTTEFSYQTIYEANQAGIACEDFLDGFMINCFRRAGDPTIYITSRSKLDAAGHFYSSKSFRTLFMESYLNQTDEQMMNEDVLQKYLSKDLLDPNSEMAENSICYSFLVQHKDHRIVSNITQNKVYLIHKCTFLDNGFMSVEEHFNNYRNYPNMNCHFVLYSDSVSKDMDIKNWMKEIINKRSWSFQGFVLKDGKGNRWRFRSDKYMAVKSLHGNYSSPIERFSQLYQQNLTQKYLDYYPEDTEFFSTCSMYLHAYLLHDILYQYHLLHTRKVTTINNIKKEYHPHLYTIHGIYLTQLRPNHKKVTIEDIHSYLLKLPWQRLSSLLLA